jgi:hypothetical protein
MLVYNRNNPTLLWSKTHFLYTYLIGSQVKSNQYVIVIFTSICVHITYCLTY